MVPAAWSIPFPARDLRKKKKRSSQADSRRPGSKSKQAPTAPPPPAWDNTVTDHSRFRLSAAEHAFRQTLRQGKPRLQQPAADVGHNSILGLRHPPSEAHRESAPSAVGCWLNAGNDEEDPSGSASRRDSLEAMRRFVKELQRKHGLGGSSATVAAADSQDVSSKDHHQQATAILTDDSKEEDGGCDSVSSGRSEYEGDEQSAPVSPTTVSAAKPPPAGTADQSHNRSEAGSDSEGEGHLGPAALRRVQQRLAAASLQQTQAACAIGCRRPKPCLDQGLLPARGPAYQQQQQQQQERSLLERLAAAEAQLDRVDWLEEQLRESRAAVAALQEQSANLQAELDACISHSLHATTQLQAQLSRVLAARGLDAGCEQQQPPSKSGSPAPHTPAVSVKVVQARAAAEALLVAQQAQQLGRGTPVPPTDGTQYAGGVQAPQQRQAGEERECPQPAGKQHPSAPHRDVLASVQLPSFKGFAELRRAAACKPLSRATAGKPQPEHTALLLAGAPSSHGSGGSARPAGLAAEGMPHPRSVPQSLLQQLGVQNELHLAAERQAAGEQGFQWRPLSSAAS